eukprot:m.204316 g.204316  ORF g.204316 m.204316 type:complete len:1263 (-) comp13741_c0_seq8:5328-9116(-)
MQKGGGEKERERHGRQSQMVRVQRKEGNTNANIFIRTLRGDTDTTNLLVAFHAARLALYILSFAMYIVIQINDETKTNETNMPSPLFHTRTVVWAQTVTYIAVMLAICDSLQSIIAGVSSSIVHLNDIINLFLFVMSAIRLSGINLVTPTFLHVWNARSAFIQLVNAIHKQSPGEGDTQLLTLRILSLFATLACVIITSMCGVELLEKDNEDYDLFSSLWFVFVTFSTVGYGDISPQTVLGQLFVMGMIIVALSILPNQFANIAEVSNVRKAKGSAYSRGLFSRKKHVVYIGGHIDVTALKDFLDEMRPEKIGYVVHVVILSPHPEPPEVEDLLFRPAYRSNTHYLQGSAMDSVDLSRACVSSADRVFVMAERNAQPDVTDRHTILRAWAVNDFAPDVELHVQVMLLESKRHVEFAHVLCFDEMKFSLLAITAVNQGASTLLTNLANSNDLETQHRLESVLDHYEQSLCNGVFEVVAKESCVFSPLIGMPFIDAAIIAFDSLVCFIGIARKDSDGVKVTLRPETMIVEEDDICVYIASSSEEHLKSKMVASEDSPDDERRSSVSAPPVRSSQSEQLPQSISESNVDLKMKRTMRRRPTSSQRDAAIEKMQQDPDDEDDHDEVTSLSVPSISFTKTVVEERLSNSSITSYESNRNKGDRTPSPPRQVVKTTTTTTIKGVDAMAEEKDEAKKEENREFVMGARKSSGHLTGMSRKSSSSSLPNFSHKRKLPIPSTSSSTSVRHIIISDGDTPRGWALLRQKLRRHTLLRDLGVKQRKTINKKKSFASEVLEYMSSVQNVYTMRAVSGKKPSSTMKKVKKERNYIIVQDVLKEHCMYNGSLEHTCHFVEHRTQTGDVDDVQRKEGELNLTAESIVRHCPQAGHFFKPGVRLPSDTWKGRFIVIGIPPEEPIGSSIYHFIRVLRSDVIEPEKLHPIVIVAAKESQLSTRLKSFMRLFPDVYYHIGSLENPQSLLRGCIRAAKVVLILAKTFTNEDAREVGMIDTTNIIAAQNVVDIFPNQLVVTELSHRPNVKFIQFTSLDHHNEEDTHFSDNPPRESLFKQAQRRRDSSYIWRERFAHHDAPSTSFVFRPTYASGSVFSSNLLRTVLYQMARKEKQHILQTFRLLLDCDETDTKLTTFQLHDAVLTNSGVQYGSVCKYLAQKKMLIPIGVRVKRELSSRSCCANGVVILTNPAFEFELAAGDVLFVLAARSEWRAGEGQGGHITAPQFAVSLLGKQKVPPAIKYGKRWLRITKERQHLRNGLEQE